MKAILERYAYCSDHTEGVLRVGEWDCYTMELPWVGNQAGKSCIPEGLYHAERGVHYATGKPAFLLLDVPDRTLIKIHQANVASELRGCIAPGLTLGVCKGQRAVLKSAGAMMELLERLGGGGELEIRSAPLRYGPRG